MVIERSRVFPRLDDFIESQHSADLHTGDLLLGSVVAKFVTLRFGEDAEKGGVAICNPVSESKAAEKHCQSSKDRVEEIKGADGGDAHQVKQGALYTQVGEGLMQTLKDAV